jgi:hypothetical protein
MSQLTSELEQLNDPEALAGWAQRALPLKNQLFAADAQTLEASCTLSSSSLWATPSHLRS